MKLSLLILPAIAVLAISSCGRRERSPSLAQPDSGVSLEPQIKFIPFINRTYNQARWNPVIARILRGFLNDTPCRDAFQQVGVDLTQLMQYGLVIAPADTLGATSSEDLTLTDDAKRTGQRLVDDWHVPAFTTTNFAGMPPSVTDGKPHIFLNQRAFSGGEDYLKQVLAHELIHAGGLPGKRPGWLGRLTGGQDLDYLGARLDSIMRDCAGN
jgi:hypothetical protein